MTVEEKRFCESTDWIRAAFCEADPRGIMQGWQLAILHLTRHVDILNDRIRLLEAKQRQGVAREDE